MERDELIREFLLLTQQVIKYWWGKSKDIDGITSDAYLALIKGAEMCEKKGLIGDEAKKYIKVTVHNGIRRGLQTKNLIPVDPRQQSRGIKPPIIRHLYTAYSKGTSNKHRADMVDLSQNIQSNFPGNNLLEKELLEQLDLDDRGVNILYLRVAGYCQTNICKRLGISNKTYNTFMERLQIRCINKGLTV